MNHPSIETDYLVVGAGATAMSFVDTLLTESDAHITVVDRHHRPGGHWNHAYPFVRLHGPAAQYGVCSRELSGWTKDAGGLNQGMYSLSSQPEILAHFEQVMQQRFVPSGRVSWLPMSDYQRAADGTHHVVSLAGGDSRQLIVHKKLVDGTHARTEVPSRHKPKYEVADGVSCVPVNALADIDRPHVAYAVVGAGKTAMDACIWLLQNGVAPERIRWIMPRDAWLMDRALVQPGVENFERSIGAVEAQLDAIASADSTADLFARLEAGRLLLRIDPSVQPTMYRCAVVSQAELAQLRRIGNIVRLGHVRRIERERIVLDHGTLPADADTLYVDCSAAGLQRPPELPIFDGDRINLLMVRWCQPLFSAALIAFVERHFDDASEKNVLCTVCPSPEKPSDWLRMWQVTLANAARWQKDPQLRAWLPTCRLDFYTGVLRGVDKGDSAKFERLKATGAKSKAAAEKLPRLLAEATAH